jgi:hypothetical protein
MLVERTLLHVLVDITTINEFVQHFIFKRSRLDIELSVYDQLPTITVDCVKILREIKLGIDRKSAKRNKKQVK